MHSLIRSSAAAAAVLAMALPASASVHPLLPAAPSMTAGHGHSPADTFQKLHAHRNAKTAHFDFPYSLAVDPVGNVFVANAENNSVATISPTFKVTEDVITAQLSTPLSIAVGPLETIYVGNYQGSSGWVESYSGNTPLLHITANTQQPFSIAVDGFGDLFTIANGGLALDDPYGNLLYNPEYGGYTLTSVALGNGNVYAFLDGNYLLGNGSNFLRTSAMQSIVGPTQSAEPVSVSCGGGACWIADPSQDMIFSNNGSTIIPASVGYQPTGIAYDQVHNRVYVADPQHNAVHVYNAQTLALEKSIT